MEEESSMIKRAGEADLNEMFSCWDLSNRHFYGPPKHKNTPDVLSEIIAGQAYSYSEVGKNVAWIAWHIQGSNCVLDGIYVRPERLRQGIGSKLLSFMMNEIRREPVSTVSRGNRVLLTAWI